MNYSEAGDILKSFNAALKSRKLYPPGHPAMEAPVKKTFQLVAQQLLGKGSIALGKVGESIVFEDELMEGSERLYGDILQYLSAMSVDAVIFEKGISERELVTVVEVLTGPALQPGELQSELHSKGVVHVTLKTVPMGKKNIVEIYTGAVEVVKGVMAEVRMGKIPKAERVNHVVDDITESVLSDRNAILGLTMIKSYDNYLYNHSVNVSVLAIALGRELDLDPVSLHAVGVAGLLHDVGKTGVSEKIIRKSGGLSSEEWDKIKEHPLLGSNLARRMDGLDPQIADIIYQHHIKYDKSGYPPGATVLNRYSQVITISDAYDALTTLRVYQKPHDPAEAVKVLQNFSGRHFDPEILKAFISMLGVYPIGTMVRLTSGEIAVVTKSNPGTPDAPVVKVLYDAEMKTLDEPVEADLSAGAGKSIVTTVNPAAVEVDLMAFFEREAG